MISAVITTHNRKEKVVRAIESVLAQSLPCRECIVVDDASVDGTQEHLAPYINSGRIKYIYIPPSESKGGNYARNTGIRAASGEYIAFLDDDDEWLPYKNEKQLSLMENSGCGACYCALCRVYHDGTAEDDDPSFLKEGDLSRQILCDVVCVTSALMVKRKLLLEIGLFDENLGFWQEYDLCIRLFQKTKGIALRDCAVRYSMDVLDPARLTNKLAGWEKAVACIKEKYKTFYQSLTAEEKRQSEIFLARDGILRSSIAGDSRRKRHYLWLMYKATKKPKDLAKFILNYGARVK